MDFIRSVIQSVFYVVKATASPKRQRFRGDDL